MEVSYKPPPVDHHGLLSKKRMHLAPTVPVPVNYATAAVPTYAPFGTEYTPEHTMKIIGSRRIAYPQSMPFNQMSDPDLAPTKSIQHVHDIDQSHWSQQSKGRFDTTYRTEYINRLRHPDYSPWYQQTLSDQLTRTHRNMRNSLNQYSILPPIGMKPPSTTFVNPNRNGFSAKSQQTDVRSQSSKPEQEPMNIPPMDAPRRPPPPPAPMMMMMNNEESYLPAEPVLLTDYEEQRLAEQVREQLRSPNTIDRLKLLYQELAAYDPTRTNYVHFSTIQMLTNQLGLYLQEDTLRFAMCKFVSSSQPRGLVNYEDMIRYLGKCLSSIYPNQYGRNSRQNAQQHQSDSSQVSYASSAGLNSTVVNDDEKEVFDPDDRQTRILLRQNLKYFDVDGSIDFAKLTRALSQADRDQSGFLNRQQIEEVIYKVRLPIQRSLIFQILEKHCKAYSRVYRWESFVRYLQEQVLDLKQVQDRSSPVYTQRQPSRGAWLDQMRRAYSEKDRLQVIERYTTKNEGPRLEGNHPSSWFSRFLRLADAMYAHRTSTNREQDFVLPRDEARRLFRAYNQVWDLKIDENQLQRVFDLCARNANIAIDDALKQLAKTN